MFADRLRLLREEKKILRKEMARILGVSDGAYSNYELGRREPDFYVLQQLADFFNVSTDYLLGRTSHIKPPSEIADKVPYIEVVDELAKTGIPPEKLVELIKQVEQFAKNFNSIKK